MVGYEVGGALLAIFGRSRGRARSNFPRFEASGSGFGASRASVAVLGSLRGPPCGWSWVVRVGGLGPHLGHLLAAMGRSQGLYKRS